MSWPELDLSELPEGAAVPPGVRTHLADALGEAIEGGLLRAGPATFRAVGFEHSDSDHGQRFVDFENAVAATIAKHGLTGDAIDQAVRGTDFGDIKPAVVEALDRIGMTYDQFVEGSTVGELMAFIDDLPTRYVTNVLRSAKHRQTQQKWEPNDFIDIISLPVAAAYCDVVVTEAVGSSDAPRQGRPAVRHHLVKRRRRPHRRACHRLTDLSLVPAPRQVD